jgi:predicted secreted Zn-dependent protease
MIFILPDEMKNKKISYYLIKGKTKNIILPDKMKNKKISYYLIKGKTKNMIFFVFHFIR